jgi:prepilin-type N-terminal cleavage/methylation domain-containing protein
MAIEKKSIPRVAGPVRAGVTADSRPGFAGQLGCARVCRSWDGRAFTLVELLVVVTILVLLVGILLPSLKTARTQGKRTVCATSLHQVGLGLISYLNEYNDRLPYASQLPSFDPWPITGDAIFIADVLLPHMGNVPETFQCPDDKPGRKRPAPNDGKSYFQSERSSYEYRTPFAGGKTIIELANMASEFTGRAIAPNSIWLLKDYNAFHGKPGQSGALRYLYVDGHVTDFENL